MNYTELRSEVRYYGCIPCNLSIAGDTYYAIITNASLHGIGFMIGSRVFDDIEDRQDISIQPTIELRSCELEIQYIHMREVEEAGMYYYGCRVTKNSNAWAHYVDILAKQFKANNKAQVYNAKSW